MLFLVFLYNCIFDHIVPEIIKISTDNIHQVIQPDRSAEGNHNTAQHNKTEIANALIRDIPNTLACQIKNATNGTLIKTTAI